MNELYDKFYELFEQEDKETIVPFVLDQLQQGKIDIIDLYSNLLTPSLNELTCKLEDKRICIWKEHVKTGIVRTIVECCYPYVIQKRDAVNSKNDKTAVIICPPEEYHDLGARMVADFFTICGCSSIFVGSNTPYNDFYNAIDVIRPSIVAISVSNYYNIVITKKIIHDIKQAVKYPVKIIVGGNAFADDVEKYKLVDADGYARSFDDIKKIVSDVIL